MPLPLLAGEVAEMPRPRLRLGRMLLDLTVIASAIVVVSFLAVVVASLHHG
jgi:hypothetical protein